MPSRGKGGDKPRPYGVYAEVMGDLVGGGEEGRGLLRRLRCLAMTGTVGEGPVPSRGKGGDKPRPYGIHDVGTGLGPRARGPTTIYLLTMLNGEWYTGER